jgi:hypothetical protein
MPSFITFCKPVILSEGKYGVSLYHISWNVPDALMHCISSARGKKVETLKEALSDYPQFEAVEIADVASGDYSEIFKGSNFYAPLHPVVHNLTNQASVLSSTLPLRWSTELIKKRLSEYVVFSMK